MSHPISESDVLAALSSQMAGAVERAASAIVTVNGRQRQAASGMVIGHERVLTADHVLEREDNLTIQTPDGRTLAARFGGRDSGSDLAILHVAGLGVDPATPATESARVGQLLLAVGRPGGEGPMASLGIVSAVGGPLRTGQGAMLQQYIQTDATPYPGFSGGALVDARGQVQAILTTGLVRGVALGIPAVHAWQIGEALAQHGGIKRGFLGISSQPVPIPEGQRGGGSYEAGLLIVRVEPGSPAAQSGLLLGDLLVALDGHAVTTADDLQSLLMAGRAGKTVPVEVIRAGSLQTIQVTIGVRG